MIIRWQITNYIDLYLILKKKNYNKGNPFFIFNIIILKGVPIYSTQQIVGSAKLKKKQRSDPYIMFLSHAKLHASYGKKFNTNNKK